MKSEFGGLITILVLVLTFAKSKKPNSCRRNHCECDKRLAEQLAEYELAWNPEYSMAFGGFDRAKSCPAVDKRTNTNNDNTHECCGAYPERFP